MGDAQAYFEPRSRADVCAFWWHEPYTELAQAEENLEQVIGWNENGEHICLALQLRHDPRMIGTLTLFALNKQCRRAEIGYLLNPEHQGAGLMHEAMRAMIDHCFGPMDLIRLEADIHPDNEASRRLLTRLGFKKEGYMPQRWIVGGDIQDTEFYGLLRSSWCK